MCVDVCEPDQSEWCTIRFVTFHRWCRSSGALVAGFEQLGMQCEEDFARFAWRPTTKQHTYGADPAVPQRDGDALTAKDGLDAEPRDACTPMPSTPEPIKPQDAVPATRQSADKRMPRELQAVLDCAHPTVVESTRATRCRQPGALREPPLRGRRSSEACEANDAAAGASWLCVASFRRITLVPIPESEKQRQRKVSESEMTDYQRRRQPAPGHRLCRVSAQCSKHCKVHNGYAATCGS